MRILILLPILALFGCRPDQANSSSDIADSVVQRLQNRIAANGELEFVCRKGQMEGFDNDWCLHFQPEGKVKLAWYSIGPQHIRGEYETRQNGRVAITFNLSSDNYPELILHWPIMILKFEDDILKLYREDGLTVQDPKYQDDEPNFWPFHEKLPEAEQDAVE